MNTHASVTTAKGTAAISSIALTGDSPKPASAIIKKIFKPTGSKKLACKPGDIFVGDIFDGDKIIDHVVIACNAEENFTINCHGNPLIVEMIMKLLKDNGAELTSAEDMLTKQFQKDPNANTIQAEAKLAQLKAVTFPGVKILENQIKAGLSQTAGNWLENIDSLPLKEIHEKCKQILTAGQTAKLIIHGCTVAIAGPPNSGKSTLLNSLAGRQKAIVADIPGTTRDWVGAKCRTESLLIKLIDTAGLDQNTTPKNTVDKEAQKRTADIMADCDLVLLVLDGSKNLEKWNIQTDKKILVVFNKSDMDDKLTQDQLDFDFTTSLRISAKTGDGIEHLLKEIQQVLSVAEFDIKQPVCFTGRQKDLIEQLLNTKTKPHAKSIISELLNTNVCV